MKLALSIDHLLERQDVTNVADVFCELYPEAEAYTVAHLPGAILGPLESRRIHSSGLSKKVQAPENLAKNSFLVPTMVQQLYIPCSVDVLFDISSGLSHAIPKCKDSYQITYIYNDYFLKQSGLSIREFFFGPYIRSWSKKNIRFADELWVATEELKKIFANHFKGEIKVVPPFVKLSEFPLIPSPLFKHDFYLIQASALSENQAQKIVDYFHRKAVRFRFIGHDDHLERLKAKLRPNSFFGERCAGELAPLINSSRGLIDLTNSDFPTGLIQALACGRPCIGSTKGSAKNFLKNPYVHLINGLDTIYAFDDAIEALEGQLKNLEPKKVRAYAMDFHDLKFKGLLKRSIETAGNLKKKELMA